MICVMSNDITPDDIMIVFSRTPCIQQSVKITIQQITHQHNRLKLKRLIMYY